MGYIPPKAQHNRRCIQHAPSWNKLLDIRIFLTLPPQIQEERIRQRSGEEMLKRFLQEWIPMENRYFETFGIAKLCDLIIDTGSQS